MRCECGRFSLDPVCSYCLTGDGTASGPKINVEVGPAYVTPAVERDGLRCPCGEPEPMVAEVFHWVDTVASVWATRPPFSMLSPERLIWYRCFACGSLTRETLVPATL